MVQTAFGELLNFIPKYTIFCPLRQPKQQERSGKGLGLQDVSKKNRYCVFKRTTTQKAQDIVDKRNGTWYN
jgi:hypothetical protein